MTTAGEPGRFAAHVAAHNVGAARLASLLVGTLMPAGVALDWVTHPEQVKLFGALRIGATLLSAATFLFTYTGWARRHSFLVGTLPAIIASSAIEVMIEHLGGYASPYYAGLNLCILGMGIVFTWRGRETAVICFVVIAIWLVPSLASGPPIELGPFFNNLYFLSLTSVIAVWSNRRRYALAQREYEATQRLTVTTAELALTLERLRELDRAKNEFFANISHELRTPLTLILAPVDEMLRASDGGDGVQRSRLDVVRRNAERLLRLIDDLLDLARLEVGGLRLTVGPVELRALAGQVVDSFRPAAETRTITLGVEAEQPTTDIHGDPHRLEMVITNLVGNALKFTPDGGRITVRVEPDGEGASVIVTDTGPGIAPRDQERIFARFYQVESSARRRFGGAGIGLSLAKELAELHGGRITVASELGHGASFRLWLPAGREHFRPEVLERRRASVAGHEQRRRASDAFAAPPPSPSAASACDLAPTLADAPFVFDGARRPRILVVEDQEELRAFIRQVFERTFEVLTAADGEAALEVTRHERPDLVITDVMMPRMTGTDLCRAIKNDPALRGTPVILLTSRTGSDAALEGYAHGADDFVTKPFHTRLLVARVEAQLKLRALALQVTSQARLAAVGTLAAGVAHEVRNPLNAIINGASVLLEAPADRPPARALLEVIADCAHRIEAITAALDEQVRPAEAGGVVPCDVRAGIDATLRLLEHRTGGVAIERRYETERRVLASAAELNQVFLNLLDNALRAPAKAIRIRVADEGRDRVVVRVTDDGPGVPQEAAERVFDPFFTTREPGEGTGLGLYLSRRLVLKYGGDLRLERAGSGGESGHGSGAEFAVELPAEVAT